MVKYIKISIKYTSKIKKGIKLYNHIYFNYWLNIQAIENKLMQCEIIDYLTYLNLPTINPKKKITTHL